jgi:ferric-dicitrate binding protein FerR (iron transport regulator)
MTGVPSHASPLTAAALAWLTRVNDPDFAAWAELETWLVKDPRHAQVYWALATREADLIDELRGSPTLG